MTWLFPRKDVYSFASLSQRRSWEILIVGEIFFLSWRSPLLWVDGVVELSIEFEGKFCWLQKWFMVLGTDFGV